MDRVEHYHQIVRTFLEEYAQESVSPNENVTAELVDLSGNKSKV